MRDIYAFQNCTTIYIYLVVKYIVIKFSLFKYIYMVCGGNLKFVNICISEFPNTIPKTAILKKNENKKLCRCNFQRVIKHCVFKEEMLYM